MVLLVAFIAIVSHFGDGPAEVSPSIGDVGADPAPASLEGLVTDAHASATREAVPALDGSILRGRLVARRWPGGDHPVAGAHARVSLFHVRSTHKDAIFVTEVRSGPDGWFEVPLPFEEHSVEYPVDWYRTLHVHVEPVDPTLRTGAPEKAGTAQWSQEGVLLADPVRYEVDAHLFTVAIVDEHGEPFEDAWPRVEIEIDWWRKGREAHVRLDRQHDDEPSQPGVWHVYGEPDVPLTYRVVAWADLGEDPDGWGESVNNSSEPLEGLEPDGALHRIVVPREMGRVRFDLVWSLPGQDELVEIVSSVDPERAWEGTEEFEVAYAALRIRALLLETVTPVLTPAGAESNDLAGSDWRAPSWREVDDDLTTLQSGPHRSIEISVPPGIWNLRTTAKSRLLRCATLREGIVVGPGELVDLGAIDLGEILHLFPTWLPWSLERDLWLREFQGDDDVSRLERVRVDGSRGHALPVDLGHHPIWYAGSKNRAVLGARRGPSFSPRGAGRATVPQPPLEDDDGGAGSWGWTSNIHPVMESSELAPWVHTERNEPPVDWLDLPDTLGQMALFSDYDDVPTIAALLGDAQMFQGWWDHQEEGFELGLYDRMGVVESQLYDRETWERNGQLALLVSSHASPTVWVGLTGRATAEVVLRENELNVIDPPEAPASGLVVRFPEARDGWRFGVRLLDWRGDPWAVAPSAIALAPGERELSLIFEAEGDLRLVPCAWRAEGTSRQFGEACNGWVEAPTRREDLPDPLTEYWPPWVPPPESGFGFEAVALSRTIALQRGSWQAVEVVQSLEELRAAFEVVRPSPPLPLRERASDQR